MGLEKILNKAVIVAGIAAVVAGCKSAPEVLQNDVEAPIHRPATQYEAPKAAPQDSVPLIWNENLTEKENKAYNLVMKVVEQYQLPKDFANTLMAVIWKESSFRPGIVAKGSGAVGYMQVVPTTAGGLGYSRDDLFDPVKNIEAGTKYLLENLNRFKKYARNNKELLGYTLVAYNMGPYALECMLKKSHRISLNDVLYKLKHYKGTTVCVDREKNLRFKLSPRRKKDAVNYHRLVQEMKSYYTRKLAYSGERIK